MGILREAWGLGLFVAKSLVTRKACLGAETCWPPAEAGCSLQLKWLTQFSGLLLQWSGVGLAQRPAP